MGGGVTDGQPPAWQAAAMPGTKVYHYPKCSTCRKALKWLDEHGVAHDKTDLVATPPTLRELKDLHRRSGLPVAKLFNTSGESYRAGQYKARLARMTEEQALAALAGDGKLIKRPIVDTGEAVLVGFDEEAYAAKLGKGRRR
jgi:arsenate reductase (glutaredoxin)